MKSGDACWTGGWYGFEKMTTFMGHNKYYEAKISHFLTLTEYLCRNGVLVKASFCCFFLGFDVTVMVKFGRIDLCRPSGLLQCWSVYMPMKHTTCHPVFFVWSQRSTAAGRAMFHSAQHTTAATIYLTVFRHAKIRRNGFMPFTCRVAENALASVVGCTFVRTR